MTIAEKLLRAKTDIDEVHGAAYAKGYNKCADDMQPQLETARTEGYNHGYQDGDSDGYNRGCNENATGLLYGTYTLEAELFDYICIDTTLNVLGKGVYGYFFDASTGQYFRDEISQIVFEQDFGFYNHDNSKFITWSTYYDEWSCAGKVLDIDGEYLNIEFTKPMIVEKRIYDAIEEILLSVADVPDYAMGVAWGAETEKKRFWNNYQNYGNQTDCANMFSGRGWNDETFAPQYDITSTNNYMMFRYTGITNLEASLQAVGKKVYIDNGNVTMTFNNTLTRIIGEVIFRTTITTFSQTFAYSTYLEEIRCELPITEATTFSSVFDGCSKLKEVRFSGTIDKNGLNFQWSNNLSRESLLNIKNCLADKSTDTSGTVWTITVGSTNKAKYTTEELEEIKAKGWNIK